MPDLLTENVLPVLGLCPPGSLLLPWLSTARDVRSRPMDLPVRLCSATFAVARRSAKAASRSPGGADQGRSQAPVAAVLLEPAQAAPVPTTLVMLDWATELSAYSGAALRNSDSRSIFGSDVQIERRCLLALSMDAVLPQGILWELSQRLGVDPSQLGWVSLRGLYDVLGDYLRRIPRDRWRAPERTAVELLGRLEDNGVLPFRSPRLPPMELLELARRLRWRYEPLRPGAREFPWCFTPNQKICDEAMVLEARMLQRRRAAHRAPPGRAGVDQPGPGSPPAASLPTKTSGA